MKYILVVVETTCDDTFNETTKQIMTPNHPLAYEPNNCTWKLIPPKGTYISLKPFKYSFGYWATCCFRNETHCANHNGPIYECEDELSFQSGEEDQTLEYHGEWEQPPVKSSGDGLTLRLKTHPSCLSRAHNCYSKPSEKKTCEFRRWTCKSITASEFLNQNLSTGFITTIKRLECKNDNTIICSIIYILL